MRALATAAIVVAQRVRWRVLVLALALLAIMVTVAPEQAAAQTDTTFISNTGQTSTTTDTIVRATSFGTGAATYTLSSVGIYLGSIPASNITPVVRIHENGMTGSFIRPGAVVATLTNPGTFQAGAVNSFNAPASTTLSASTTYWVVTTNSAATNGTGFQVSTINSSNLDSGTAAGWTLGASRFKTNITLSFWTNSNVRIRFAIRGAVANTAPTASDSTVTTNEDTDYTFTAANFVITVEVTAQDGQATQTYTVTVTRAAGLSSDATLSSLTLSGIDFGTFDPTTTSYRARVASETTETTVTPTVTHSAASYVIKLGGVTDADGVVSLSEVSNVIAVDVTAEDGETSQTYTVTVARGPSPCVTGGAVSDSTNTGLAGGDRPRAIAPVAKRNVRQRTYLYHFVLTTPRIEHDAVQQSVIPALSRIPASRNCPPSSPRRLHTDRVAMGKPGASFSPYMAASQRIGISQTMSLTGSP